MYKRFLILTIMILGLTFNPLWSGESNLFQYGFEENSEYLIHLDFFNTNFISGNEKSNEFSVTHKIKITPFENGNYRYEIKCINIENSKLDSSVDMKNFNMPALGETIILEYNNYGNLIKVIQSPIEKFENFAILDLPVTKISTGKIWEETGNKYVKNLGSFRYRYRRKLVKISRTNTENLAFFESDNHNVSSDRTFVQTSLNRMIFDLDKKLFIKGNFNSKTSRKFNSGQLEASATIKWKIEFIKKNDNNIIPTGW